MIDPELRRMCVRSEASLREALQAIELGASRICLVIDRNERLTGILTDGNARRALLGGESLDGPVSPYVTERPYIVSPTASRAHVLDLMQALRITEVPVVDGDGTLVALHTLSGVLGHRTLPNLVVIMAGGRGSRLGDLTNERPKPLMNVAGRPILEWIVLNLVSSGVRRIFISVNYRAGQIEEHMGDGSRFGCEIRYLQEQPDHPLGTAGSLSILRGSMPRPDLKSPILVMNGDLMAQFSAGALLTAHESSGAVLTVGVREYVHEVPYGVIEHSDDMGVTVCREKPSWTAKINGGIYVVSWKALDLVPQGVPSTMPDLIGCCLQRGWPVSAWNIETDWIDVGTPAELARAKGLT